MRKDRFIKLKLFIAAIFMLLAPAASFAWGPNGHRIVGEIAQHHLSKQAQRAIFKIMGQQKLAMIANWPDFIKSDTTGKYNHTSNWHYLNAPSGMNAQEFNDFVAAQSGTNVYTQSQAMIKLLKDPNTDQEQKMFALSFLVHMIGDMHQPMHLGRKDDLGGNKVVVSWFGKKTNLHHVWDEELVDFQQLSYTEYANALDIAPETQVRDWQNSDMKTWLYESHLIADKIYAKTKPEDNLSYKYNFIFVEDMNNQLLKGGLRLAKVLNDIFG